MVSIEQTSRKYRGRKAATYDAIRTKQQRWKMENDYVDRVLRQEKPKTVIDVPFGTGRFVDLYRSLKCAVTAVDISGEMLELARKKMKKGDKITLTQGDATKLPELCHSADCVVCVRFLDLIDERAMQEVVKCLCQMATRFVVLTIRFGPRYVPKSNTAEHDEKKFRAMVKRLGFSVAQEHPIFDAGWTVLKLRREK